jgi:hypothetical protein
MIEDMESLHDDSSAIDETDSSTTTTTASTTTPSLDSLSLNHPDSFARGSSMASVMREDSFASSNTQNSHHSRESSSPSRQSSRSSFSFKRNRTGSTSSLKKPKVEQEQEKDHRMCSWLSTGNVIYKSVGMGLMDVVVGGDLVRIARERGVGVNIPDF